MVKRRTQAEIETTAYHEAGHAIQAYFLGRPIDAVSIRRRKRVSGHMESPKSLRTGGKALAELLTITLAGIAADEIYQWLWAKEKRSDLPGVVDDTAKFGRVWMGKDWEQEDDRREIVAECQRLLPPIRAFISGPVASCAWHAVAAELLKHRRLDGDQMRSVIERVEKAHDDIPSVWPGVLAERRGG